MKLQLFFILSALFYFNIAQTSIAPSSWKQSLSRLFCCGNTAQTNMAPYDRKQLEEQTRQWDVGTEIIRKISFNDPVRKKQRPDDWYFFEICYVKYTYDLATKIGEITNIYTSKDARGSGHGSKMLEKGAIELYDNYYKDLSFIKLKALPVENGGSKEELEKLITFYKKRGLIFISRNEIYNYALMIYPLELAQALCYFRKKPQDVVRANPRTGYSPMNDPLELILEYSATE